MKETFTFLKGRKRNLIFSVSGHLIVFLCILFICFRGQGSLYSPGWPLSLTLPASASYVFVSQPKAAQALAFCFFIFVLFIFKYGCERKGAVPLATRRGQSRCLEKSGVSSESDSLYASPYWGFRHMLQYLAFIWALEIQTQGLMVAWQTLYSLSHLSPSF